MGHIRLPSPGGSTYTRPLCSALSSLRVPEASKRLIRILVDTLVSLAFAFFLIAIFVAESTGAVLSANIFADNSAVLTSPLCVNLAPSSPRSEGDAFKYQQACYEVTATDARCNAYVNRTITYTDQIETHCPFKDAICLEPAYSLDTGFVNAKVIGLNTARDYFVRRTTSCAPILSKENAAFFTIDLARYDKGISSALPPQFAGCGFTEWAGSLDGLNYKIYTPKWTTFRNSTE